jgi:hypothetical protein
MQTVFDRFTAWLKKIYSSIRDELNLIYRQEHGTDLPILTGEVRQVMDRMLASDKQIEQAQQIRGMSPIFRSQEEAGMSDEEWAAYTTMHQEATDEALTKHRTASLRQMKWLSNAKSKALKALQAEAKAIRETMRAEVTREIMEQPIYKAAAALKQAKTEIERIAVADAFGYTRLNNKTLEDLESDIKAAPSLKDAINTRLDQRMLEEHGELTDPGALADAVDRAVHNEARARFIGVELRHLSKSQKPVRIMLEAARQAARGLLGKKALKAIRSASYATSEARAAESAEMAMTKGDTAAATRYKEYQLLQNQLAAEALRVREEIAQGVRQFQEGLRSG